MRRKHLKNIRHTDEQRITPALRGKYKFLNPESPTTIPSRDPPAAADGVRLM